MKRQEIFEKVQAIVAKHLEVAQQKVDCDFPLFEATRLQEAKQTNCKTNYPIFFELLLGSVSIPEYNSELIDNIELIMALEGEFDIEIPDEDIENF